MLYNETLFSRAKINKSYFPLIKYLRSNFFISIKDINCGISLTCINLMIITKSSSVTSIIYQYIK